ncbi:MFS transporter [Phytohalomonas tamaricis]|uniref:MFS transporter n=1 Tax=Phytohalomonas tamaricis TaxID=2081032 RepID=UPI000D0B18E0|nr:MFS transporter [Phytohalomonas tamaricis]
MARQLLALVFPPLLGLFILALGNGFLSTLVTLRLNAAGASVDTVGWVSSAYYIGLAVGALLNDRLLLRIGHIRSYSCFASIVAAAALGQALWLDAYWWFFLRLLGGWATVGVYLVIESWLLTSGDRAVRGRVLAFYMISLYAALALGQLLLGLFDLSADVTPYVLIGMLASLSVLPLAIIPRVSPLIEHAEPLSPLRLAKMTPTGVMGSFGSGLLVAALYSLLPLYLQQINYDIEGIGQLMAIVIVGGMALQYPIGRWSDRHDRQIVLILLGAVLVVLALLIPLAAYNFWTLAVTLFLYGGAAFSFYPVSISHSADRAPPGALVGMSQGLLLINAVGCTISAPILTSVMSLVGDAGLFYGFAAVSLVMGLFFAWRRSVKPAPQPVAPFSAHPVQSVVGAELEVTNEMVEGVEEHAQADALEAERRESALTAAADHAENGPSGEGMSSEANSVSDHAESKDDNPPASPPRS